jgi:flagellar biosynthesis protein FlhG
MTDEKEIKRPITISIASGKGGVGKSVLTSNIANALAKEHKVLVWDANLNFPNQHLLIGVEPPIRLTEVYAERVSVDQAIFRVAENFYLLADLPAAGKNENIPPGKLREVYNEILARTEMDFILIDTPAGASDEVIECCEFADLANIVITDEPTSLIDAYALIKILLGMVPPEKINLLVNNVIDMEDADEITTKLNLATEKFLGLKLHLSGFVPYDRVVRQSIIRQELFTNSDAGSEVSEAVEKIADKFSSLISVSEV